MKKPRSSLVYERKASVAKKHELQRLDVYLKADEMKGNTDFKSHGFATARFDLAFYQKVLKLTTRGVYRKNHSLASGTRVDRKSRMLYKSRD